MREKSEFLKTCFSMLTMLLHPICIIYIHYNRTTIVQINKLNTFDQNGT